MGPAIEIFNDLAATWSGSIVRAAWQGGLAIGAVWVLVRCRPGLPPRVGLLGLATGRPQADRRPPLGAPLLLPLLPPPTRPGSIPGDDLPLPTDRRARPTDRGRSVSAGGELAATP